MRAVLVRTLAVIRDLSSRQKPERAWPWSLAVLALIELLAFHSALTGNWWTSGNDMRFILPELRTADSGTMFSWLTGPWVGHALFDYYRPVTSLFMLGQYRLFGENAAAWQAVSLILHVANTLMLADTLKRVFGGMSASLVGASVWAFHNRMGPAIAWTPAQTDLFAGFFFMLSIVCCLRLLETGSRGFGSMAAVAGLLALGSKETALVLPAIVTILALRYGTLPRKGKFAVVAVAWGLSLVFVLCRTYALGGTGYLPGRSLPEDVVFYLRSISLLMLPSELGPASGSDPWAILIVGVGLAGTTWMATRGKALWYCPAIVALMLATWIIEPFAWTMNRTLLAFAEGLLWIAALVMAVAKRRGQVALTLAWGVVVMLPVLRLVYNAAGNVFYLPMTYWALVWACVVAAGLDAIGERWKSSAASLAVDAPAKATL